MNVDPVTGEVIDDDGVDVEVALPVRRYATVEAASRKASLVGPDKVRTLKVPATLVRLAEATVDRGPLIPYLESLLPAQERRRTGGKVRALGVRGFVVALLLLARACQIVCVSA